MNIDHLVGQQAESIEDYQAITFQDGTIVHAAMDVPAEIIGLTLVQVNGQDDPEQQTEMTFGQVTLDGQGNSTISGETVVSLDPLEYGVASAGGTGVVYPERPEESNDLPDDPSAERVADAPLEPSQKAAEAPVSRSEATPAPKKGKSRAKKE
jgi:hypothetical protein